MYLNVPFQKSFMLSTIKTQQASGGCDLYISISSSFFNYENTFKPFQAITIGSGSQNTIVLPHLPPSNVSSIECTNPSGIWVCTTTHASGCAQQSARVLSMQDRISHLTPYCITIECRNNTTRHHRHTNNNRHPPAIDTVPLLSSFPHAILSPPTTILSPKVADVIIPEYTSSPLHHRRPATHHHRPLGNNTSAIDLQRFRRASGAKSNLRIQVSKKMAGLMTEEIPPSPIPSSTLQLQNSILKQRLELKKQQDETLMRQQEQYWLKNSEIGDEAAESVSSSTETMKNGSGRRVTGQELFRMSFE